MVVYIGEKTEHTETLGNMEIREVWLPMFTIQQTTREHGDRDVWLHIANGVARFFIHSECASSAKASLKVKTDQIS